ncbi:PIG-L family deacetylase [Cellulomonas iranensis]|uniref:LmbE family N-acetylglucosaminyl deacetylase/ActR/RegA family two-component response regulator n=1 Tax=Cellulomonas iranensis TaxID=76862 RepID=A0ABU0GIK4_9CELL|nr:PIG-L family deacetylase [Cellulomonas iranensis]MDQ0425172.1 LmbE family N-acetylglucosaminyl deacetylase/ActR/RegA family two-component response regulator [Cellulomonas iranensis]
MADDPYRALVLEDDPDAADLLRITLVRVGLDVDVVGTAEAALAALARARYDVLVTDIQLPGRSGLQLLPEVRRLDPTLTVMVVTAYPTFDHAVEALREAADEFLAKPVDPDEVARRATELARVARSRRGATHRRVLAVGAHPDDVEIGAGATLAAHHAAGDEIVILTLSGGAVGGSTSVRQAESAAAAAVVGAHLVHLDFPDTRIVPADGVITAVEQVVQDVRPDRIYTHGAHDRHQDHRATHEAVQVAARQVPNLWCFQSPSSTVAFAPNRFVDVTGFVDTKLQMLAAYESQAHRDYMQPDVVRAAARYWSRFGAGHDVEPLETVRASETPADAAAALASPPDARTTFGTDHGTEG